MKEGSVSVIIPTFRRPDKLDRAIDSVLAQTYSDVEVIVVDDNEPFTEGRQLTEQIMQRYESNARVKYIKHEHNKNGSAARNTGARSSDAEYVAFLDDDDEFYPEKIKAQVELMSQKGDEYGCCYTKHEIKRPDGTLFTSDEKREGNMYLTTLMRDYHPAAGSNLLVRKKVFDQIGGFDESFIRNQDIEFLARLLKTYKIAYTDVLGLRVNLHTNHNYFDFQSVTEQYLEKFEVFIEELSSEDKETFYKTINRQRLYDFLINKKSLSKSLEFIWCGNSTYCDLLAVIWLRFKKGLRLLRAKSRL